MDGKDETLFDFGDDTERRIEEKHLQDWFIKRFSSDTKKRSFLDGKKHLSCMQFPKPSPRFDYKKFNNNNLDSYDEIWNDILFVNNRLLNTESSFEDLSDKESEAEETNTSVLIAKTT